MSNVAGATVRVTASSVAISRNSVAAFAFLTWDIIITMDQEVKYIWKEPTTYMSYVYFFVRYFAWISQIVLVGGVDVLVSTNRQPSPAECRSWLVWQTVSAQVELASVEMILIMRVHALYARNRRILIWLLSLYVLEIIAMTISLGFSVNGSQILANCETILPLTITGYGLASFLYETFLLAMLSYRVVGSMHHVRILQVMFRDGLWAYTLISVIIFANILLHGLVKNALSNVFFPWLMTISAFVGYRLLLNLREEVSRGNREEPEADNERRSTDIEFTVFNDASRHHGTIGGEGTARDEGSREEDGGERTSASEVNVDEVPRIQGASKGKEVLRDEGPIDYEETPRGEGASKNSRSSEDEENAPRENFSRRERLLQGEDTSRGEGSSRSPGTLNAL